MAEVGVGVDVDQADPADRAAGRRVPAHGQRRAEQDRAVAAEDDREVTGREDRADPVGQPADEHRDLVGLGDAVAGLPAGRVVAGRGDAARVAGAQPGQQAAVAQGAGGFRAAGDRGRGRWPQPQVATARRGRRSGASRPGSEERARQRPAGFGDGGVVGPRDGEQRDEVCAHRLAFVAGGAADQVDEAAGRRGRPGRSAPRCRRRAAARRRSSPAAARTAAGSSPRSRRSRATWASPDSAIGSAGVSARIFR